MLGPAGMFANINEVVCHLNLAEKNQYNFAINWKESPYKDDFVEGDPWTYFFENCFEEAEPPNASEVLPYVGDSSDKVLNIMRPRVYNHFGRGPMLLPSDRPLARRLIETYIKPKAAIRRNIDEFEKEHFTTYVIGLHLRGPGRLHGGTRQLKRKYVLKHGVPFGLYFGHVDAALASHPDAKIFVCSDSEMVIGECKARYGDRVLSYTATRSEFGEMHQEYRKSPEKYSGYKLGEDVIVEGYLLSKTHYFVHGNSNVSNFVLCLNPSQESKYVYAEDPHTSAVLHLLNRILDLNLVQKAKRRWGRRIRKALRTVKGVPNQRFAQKG